MAFFYCDKQVSIKPKELTNNLRYEKKFILIFILKKWSHSSMMKKYLQIKYIY